MAPQPPSRPVPPPRAILRRLAVSRIAGPPMPQVIAKGAGRTTVTPAATATVTVTDPNAGKTTVT